MKNIDIETRAARLIADLNRTFKESEKAHDAIKECGQDDHAIASELQRWNKLDSLFEKTLKELKAIGKTVAFDGIKGEYVIDNHTFHIEYRIVSIGSVEIEAANEQLALMKARELADYDKIPVVQVSAKLTNRTEPV